MNKLGNKPCAALERPAEWRFANYCTRHLEHWRRKLPIERDCRRAGSWGAVNQGRSLAVEIWLASIVVEIVLRRLTGRGDCHRLAPEAPRAAQPVRTSRTLDDLPALVRNPKDRRERQRLTRDEPQG
ncbi:MAG: hypothetical protein ACREYF_10665 [Gammaproteobacteria bacterium]